MQHTTGGRGIRATCVASTGEGWACTRPARFLALVLLVAIAAGCGGGLGECRRLVEAGRHEEATMRCSEHYERTADPDAGVLAATADQALGRDEAVLAWRERLLGSAGEAAAWRLAGSVHLRRGEIAAARDAYERAHALHEARGDAAGAARASYGLYYLAWQGSHLGEALDHAAAAYREARDAGDAKLEAQAINSLYVALLELGDLAGAAAALGVAFELTPVEERTGLLLNRGIVEAHRGRPALARAAFEDALAGAGVGVEPRLLRSILFELAKVELDLGDPGAAAGHLAAAAAHVEAHGSSRTAYLYFRARLALAQGDAPAALAAVEEALAGDPAPGWRWDLLDVRGRAAEELGDPASAERAYTEAIAAVEETRSALRRDDLKAWILARKRRIYDALVSLQARQGRFGDALLTMERARARAFVDAFVESGAEAVSAETAAEPWVGSGERLDLLDTLLPAVAASPVVAQRGLAELRQTLAGTRVVMHYTAGEEVWQVTLEAGRPRMTLLPTSATELRRLVERFLAAVDDPGLAAELGGILLPRGLLPEPGGTVHLVPDGELAHLPFAALLIGGRRLAEDYSLAYAPSLNALAALAAHPGGAATGPPVVLGDPAGDLPGARRELAEVARRLEVTALAGERASRRELERATGSRLLHLATHTGFGPRGPWLALADGPVGAEDLVSRRIGPRFVALASCASAVEARRGAWGSLGAAFLAAGSRAALASLWSVDDATTRRLIAAFYDRGGAGDPAGALAGAQREWIAAARPPSEWAGLVILGSGQPVEKFNEPSTRRRFP